MSKALIIIDYQNDFVTGSLGFERAKDLDSKLSNRIEQAIEDEERIIYTIDSHLSHSYLDSEEGRHLPIKHCIVGSKGYELHGITGKKLYSMKNAQGITKNTFGALNLGNYLRQFPEIKEIELCGIVTNICVISNAIIAKASLPNARIIINAELCASNDIYTENMSLDLMESLHMEIINRRKVD